MKDALRSPRFRFTLLVALMFVLAAVVRPEPAIGAEGSTMMCNERTWTDSFGQQVTTHKFGGGACYGQPYAPHTIENMGYCSGSHPTCP